MNGIHDMGGMQGLGEIGYRENEPWFHEPWEMRLWALVQASRVGSLRTYIENIPAANYSSDLTCKRDRQTEANSWIDYT